MPAETATSTGRRKTAAGNSTRARTGNRCPAPAARERRHALRPLNSRAAQWSRRRACPASGKRARWVTIERRLRRRERRRSEPRRRRSRAHRGVPASPRHGSGNAEGPARHLYFPLRSRQTQCVVARGWGRSEEDLGAEKEQAREERASVAGGRTDQSRETLRRGLKLSLARIEEQLGKTSNAGRRQALEAARSELLERLERL